MTFKAKLSKQGNSYCVYIPKDVRTKLEIDVDYEWSVRTETTNVRTSEPARDNNVYTSKKHKRLVFNIKKGINEWIIKR